MMSTVTLLTILLVSGVVFVNGWTDAPNAISGAVNTGALTYRNSVELAAVFNLLGVGAICLCNSSVADTITSMVDFGGRDSRVALIALCSAMLSIVLFAVGAWCFGIPTSESHALIAALAGSSLAINPASGLDMGSIYKVVLGLVLSIIAGLGAGTLVTAIFQPFSRRLSKGFLLRGQIASAAVMAFLHGAQDGQKFVAVFVIAELLSKGGYNTGPVELKSHLLVVIFCSAVMALGTSVGGKKIIDTVGSDMVKLDPLSGFCSDVGAALCLLGATWFGIPVSTTHTKTTAVMGAGLACGDPVDLNTVGQMFLAWGLTFPACGGLGYLFTRMMLFA